MCVCVCLIALSRENSPTSLTSTALLRQVIEAGTNFALVESKESFVESVDIGFRRLASTAFWKLAAKKPASTLSPTSRVWTNFPFGGETQKIFKFRFEFAQICQCFVRFGHVFAYLGDFFLFNGGINDRKS